MTGSSGYGGVPSIVNARYVMPVTIVLYKVMSVVSAA